MMNDHISGIHNYCDRWCERCFFTSRCSVYADERASKDGDLDIRNKAFWERLAQNFSKARRLLEETAEKNGIDLRVVEEEVQATEKKHEQIRQQSKNHSLSKFAWEYSELARKWLDTQPGMIDKLTDLKHQLELDSESQEQAKNETNTIRDCLAVIQWYSSFIHVKLMRALMGKMNADDYEFEDDDRRDFDGSAKIAMISIDRSMQAWTQLYEMMPAQEDEFLKVLSLLERIKRLASLEFPNALQFKRPGFDDHEMN